MEEQISLQDIDLMSLDIYPEVGLYAGLYSNSISIFLRNFHTDCHSGYTNVQFHQ